MIYPFDGYPSIWENISKRIHPPVASAVVEKPEYDPDHVYAWKPANNYKGWKLIARGKAGEEDASVIQKALDQKGVIVSDSSQLLISEPLTVYSNTTIRGFNIKGDPTKAIFQFADAVENVVIEGNILDGGLTETTTHGVAEGTGIIDTVYDTPWSSKNIKIRNNIIKNHYGKGIFIKNDVDVEICGNIIENVVLGISCGARHAVVKDNIIKNTADAFIDVGGGAQDPYDVVIKNNICKGIIEHGLGIDIFGSAHDIIIKGNFIYVERAGAGTTSDGIAVHKHTFNEAEYYPSNVTIRGNRIYNSDRHGIFLDNVSGEIVIEGNTIKTVDNDGISLWDINYAIIKGNVINSANNGIGLHGASQNNEIHKNIVREPSYSGIGEFDDADYNVITENSIYGTPTYVILKLGANTVVKRNKGYLTENSGTATFSGDGSKTQFSIEHGLVSTPSKVLVTPMTADAAGDFYVTADDTYIYINYKTAPPSGTDNIKVSFYAEV